ncbi:hypothetical protein TPA2_gp64 [Tsukamurella phage TPA2]|uniref:hypothetical protein n=1 Tax=Tsukamurella phage TPA2 TaxID=981330 RepID=UPI0001FF8DD7|nr:hypothetical protein TPA2_gp64 [Tsukamurella phage TPA2]ADX31978.1 hypothetical protein [Tsukamurella phage TPA2]
MYETLKFSLLAGPSKADDRDVWLVVMDHQIEPRFAPTVIKANDRIGVWSTYRYVPATKDTVVVTDTWQMGRLTSVLGNPKFTINGLGLHVTGPEEAPRIQVRFNGGDEMEEVTLTGARPEIFDVDTKTTTVGPQICPVGIAAGSGGGRRDGGEVPGSGGGGGPHVPWPGFAPREELAPKPSPIGAPITTAEPVAPTPEMSQLQFAPLLREDVPSARIVAEDGDRRVEIEITNPGGAAYAAQLASEHIVAIVNALGGAK